MRNLKAIGATERAELFTTLFDNPEITAMAAICEILKELPDDAARMRVMRWSFGRFSEEFKRPLTEQAPEPRPLQTAPTPAPAPLPAATRAPAPLRAEATAPAPASSTDPRVEPEDFAREISELRDLFPAAISGR
jgi:hypothetical protein